MTSRVNQLLNTHTFLTSAGTETYLIFQQGFDLPEFCAFLVHENEEAWQKLQRDYLGHILDTVANNDFGLLLDVLVWRAQPDYIVKYGHTAEQLAFINERAVSLARESVRQLCQEKGYDENKLPILLVGDIGPRGDGYRVENAAIEAQAARDYHRAQISALANAEVDLICALTMTTAAETIGIVQAANESGLPVIVSATVETDGRLPDGTHLSEFIQTVDEQTQASPLFYMVNCAHPTHLQPTLLKAKQEDAEWLSRFRGLRANASTKSHEELDNSTELDRGDVAQFANHMAELHEEFNFSVIGGCCGTDHMHLASMVSRLKK